MVGSGAAALLSAAGCAAKYGSRQSYLTPILRPENQDTVTYWLDVIMQQVRDQRVPPPRAAYNFA
ncbi:MAG: hypothetical protein AAGJ09_14855, partial [Pseudomonadota bacterium]